MIHFQKASEQEKEMFKYLEINHKNPKHKNYHDI